MSQDYNKKRATITGSTTNNILANLDPQQLSNISHLPQPLSKRNSINKRSSMPDKRLSNGKLLNLGQAVTTTTGALSHKRRSSSGLQDNNSKRTSLGGRKSLIPNNNNNNRLSMYNVQTQIKDSRPLRDKNYQLQLQQEILDFLSYKNLFEIEMKHPLTNKTLKQPTQKDFVLIFQWLYHRTDPGYKFQKSIEQEVYFLLKTMRYPYLESINKSQISAVGGQHWPIFLGMLHWMVQFNLTVMKLDDDEDLVQNSDDSILNDESEEEDEINDFVDKLYVRYVLKSYKAFLNNEDDYSEYQQELEQDFEASNQEDLNKVEELKQKIENLIEDYNKVKKQNDIITSAINKSRVLEDDTVKFKDYINKMENSKTRWDTVISDLKSNIEQQDLALKKIGEEKQNIYRHLQDLGFTVSDLDKMSQDRERLTKTLENCNSKYENTNKMVKEKETSCSDSFYSLEGIINNFNSRIYKISNAINMNEYEIDNKFEINSFDISLLSNEKLGLKPDAMISELKEYDLKNNLFKLKRLITEKMHQLQDETIKVQEQLDSLQESIKEEAEKLESLESSLSSSKLLYDQLYENFNQESSNANLEIEKLQRDLQILNFKKQESTMLVNQRYNNIKLEYDTLKHDLNFNKLELHGKVEKYLEFIINFKLNIQANLEDFENLVIEECEKEFL